MCGGTLALLEDSLSRGCYLQCSELLALGGVLPNLKLELSHKEPKQQTDPGSCARVVYIAGDTLRHQPIGTGHMTVLQFHGPITFCVLQWCHPMQTRTLWRTSCSTRMIALYSDRKWIQARAHIITSNRRKSMAKYIQYHLKQNLYQWLIFWHIMNLVGLNEDR